MASKSQPIGRSALAAALAASSLFAVASFTAATAASTSRGAARPPVNVSPPLIAGKAQEGQILRVGLRRWRSKTVRNAIFFYEWRLCDSTGSACAAIVKATDSIYAIRHGDVGRTLRVVVTATRKGMSVSATSAATAPVSAAPVDAPVNTARPTIIARALQPAVLTARAGGWTGNQPIRLEYRWRRCNAQGGTCQDLDRTGQTYTLGSKDVGRALRVLVIAQNAVGTSAALSGPTPSVAGPAGPAGPPRNTSPPLITGTAQQGKTLTASSGTWTGTQPMSFSFQWLRCGSGGGHCSSIAGATNQTYALVAADAGGTIRIRVTATNVAGSASARSDPTKVVVATNAPINTSLPIISGTAREGETLTASSGSWRGTRPISFTFQWLRCNRSGAGCGAIGGATRQTYTLLAADVGQTMRVRVTATNAAGSATVLSQPSAVVAGRGAAPANTAPPTLSGRAQQGQTLAVSNGSWSGTPPIGFRYVWQRCDANGNNCVSIAGARSNRYSLTRVDVARRLRVQVTASSSFGSATALSNLSDLVKGPPVLVTLPTISGQAMEGQALTAATGSWRSLSALSFTFQWARCNAQGADCEPITGAGPQLRTYAPVTADVGHRLIVQVKAINQSGASFANSRPTAVVTANPAPKNFMLISSVSLPDRLVIDRVQFIPNRIRFRSEPLIARFHVSEIRQGKSVRGALVFAVGVPFNRLSGAPEVRTGDDGWAQITFRVKPTFRLRRGNFVVVFVRARKPGENVLAGVSTRRLVSVRVG